MNLIFYKHREQYAKLSLQNTITSERFVIKALYYILIGVMLLSQDFIYSQEIDAVVRVDSQHITIGDWLRGTLEIKHISDVQLFNFVLPDSLGEFEIVRKEQPTTEEKDGKVLEKIPFIITAFDSGMRIISPIHIGYKIKGDTSLYSVATSPLIINVRGVVIDTTQDIRDIKPPLSVPITFAEILPYLISVVVISAAGFLIWYIIKKRKRGERLIPEAPPRPPHEIALEELKSLESEKLWQRGKVKEYHSKLTDIVRVYIENRFEIKAMEITSDEILEQFSLKKVISKELYEGLKEILFRADLVKFAKYQPISEENERSLAEAYRFIQSTIQEISPETRNQEEVEVTAQE